MKRTLSSNPPPPISACVICEWPLHTTFTHKSCPVSIHLQVPCGRLNLVSLYPKFIRSEHYQKQPPKGQCVCIPRSLFFANCLRRIRVQQLKGCILKSLSDGLLDPDYKGIFRKWLVNQRMDPRPV